MAPGRIDTASNGDGRSGPTLRWNPVDGAALYRLVIVAADGHPYWAWSGSETVVEVPDDEMPETVGHAFEPMTWQVTAYDATGAPIAFSESHALDGIG